MPVKYNENFDYLSLKSLWITTRNGEMYNTPWYKA